MQNAVEVQSRIDLPCATFFFQASTCNTSYFCSTLSSILASNENIDGIFYKGKSVWPVIFHFDYYIDGC